MSRNSRAPRIGQGIAAVVIALMLLASGCQLQSGAIALPTASANLVAEPELVCPADRVAIRWDLTRLPRSSANCRRCVSSSGCSAGFSCIDGVCCRGSELSGGAACDVGGECLPLAIDMTLTPSDSAVTPPTLPTPLPLRGAISLPAIRTMDVVARGQFVSPLANINDRAHVRVPVEPDDRLPLQFSFECSGSSVAWTFSWTSHDFAVLGPSTSDHVRIRGIRNVNPFPVMLTGGIPSRGPVRIEVGGTTTAFDDSPARGLWQAFIPNDGRVGMPVPTCGATVIANRLPDIRVDLRLACQP